MDPVIAAKIAVASIGTIAALIAAGTPMLLSIAQKAFDRLLYGTAVGSRIGLFVIVYIVLGFRPQSDALVYYDWSKLILSGHIPGESEMVPLHYGPLFLYLTALPLRVVDSGRTIVLLMTIAELSSIPIWLAVARRAFSEVTARRAMLLYVLCPLTLLTSAIGANNDALASLFVATGIWLFIARKQMLSGLVVGLGVACSKLLVAAVLPVLALKARRPVAWCGTTAAIPIVAYGAWFLMGIDPISGLQFHSQLFSSGNLPFLLGFLDINLMYGGGRRAINAVVLVVLGCIFWFAFLLRRSLSVEQAYALFGALFAAFMFISAKAFSHYWIVALVPVLCVLASERETRWPMLWYAIFSFTASIESTLWFRLFDNQELSTIAKSEHGATGALWLFLSMEVLLVTSYIMILLYCCRRVIDDRTVFELSARL